MTYDKTSYYEKAMELAESGQYEQSLTYIKEHIRHHPNDAQALNDTGAILHCLNREQEAIEYLIRAKQFNSQCPEIIWNLAEAYIAAGKASEAALLFEQMEQMNILNPDIVNQRGGFPTKTIFERIKYASITRIAKIASQSVI